LTAATPLMLDNTTLFIALGHRCSAAAILDRCRLAGASFPFDGIVSKLSVIRDCLETDFQELLDVRHYVKVSTKTVNVIDGVVQELLTESPWVNRHYQAASGAGGGGDLTGSSTYHLGDQRLRHTQERPARRIHALQCVSVAPIRQHLRAVLHPGQDTGRCRRGRPRKEQHADPEDRLLQRPCDLHQQGLHRRQRALHRRLRERAPDHDGYRPGNRPAPRGDRTELLGGTHAG
jgi:hypothetical protein